MLLVQYLGTDKTTLIHFLIQTASHHLPMDSPVFKKIFFFLLLFLLPFSALPPPLCSYTSHHCWILMILLRFHQAALSQFHVFVRALKTFHSRIGFTPSLKKTFSDTSLSMPCFFHFSLIGFSVTLRLYFTSHTFPFGLCIFRWMLASFSTL